MRNYSALLNIDLHQIIIFNNVFSLFHKRYQSSVWEYIMKTFFFGHYLGQYSSVSCGAVFARDWPKRTVIFPAESYWREGHWVCWRELQWTLLQGLHKFLFGEACHNYLSCLSISKIVRCAANSRDWSLLQLLFCF